jgi:hypothetical protein
MQQWLSESAPVLPCTYIVCLVPNYLALDEKSFIKFHQLAWV